MLTISMTCFNRSAYLKECLGSFLQSVLIEPVRLVITDDASSDEDTLRFLGEFSEIKLPNLEVVVRYRAENLGCDQSNLEAIQYCFDTYGVDRVLVQDSDAVFNRMWLMVLQSVMQSLSDVPAYVLSLWKHPGDVLGEFRDLDVIPIVNGLNLLVLKKIFDRFKYVSGTWDGSLSDFCWKHDIPVYRTKVSLVRHIGLIGSHDMFGEAGNLDFVR